MNNKLQQLMAKAKETNVSSNSDGGKYPLPYKSVFVSPLVGGTIPDMHVRLLLPDSADGQIGVAYWTHWLGKDGGLVKCGWSIPGQAEPHCAVCEALKEVKTSTGADYGKECGAKSRSMILAQFISSSGYANLDKYPHPAPGEVFVAQGPAGMFYAVNDVILKASAYPESLQSLILSNVGSIVSLSRTKENRASVTQVGATFQSAASQEEFSALTAKLPSVQDLLYPGGLEQIEEEKMLLQNYANGLLKKAHSTPQAGSTPAHMGTQDVMMANQFQPAPSLQVPQQAPYGQQVYQATEVPHAPAQVPTYGVDQSQVPQSQVPHYEAPQVQSQYGQVATHPSGQSTYQASPVEVAPTYASPTAPTYPTSDAQHPVQQAPESFGQSPDQALQAVTGSQQTAQQANPPTQVDEKPTQQFQQPTWTNGGNTGN